MMRMIRVQQVKGVMNYLASKDAHGPIKHKERNGHERQGNTANIFYIKIPRVARTRMSCLVRFQSRQQFRPLCCE